MLGQLMEEPEENQLPDSATHPLAYYILISRSLLRSKLTIIEAGLVNCLYGLWHVVIYILRSLLAFYPTFK